MSEDIREVVDGDVKVLVKKPGKKEHGESQIVYNKSWRKYLENGIIVRAKLNQYLTDQGIWDAQKQDEYDKFVSKINERELILKKGGIPLKKAKAIALELKGLRVDFRNLIADRISYDGNTAEGMADNDRFDYYVTACVLDPETKKPLFKDLEDYNKHSTEPWAIKAASELANMIYGLDPNFEKNQVENTFLRKFNFTDSEGRLINKDGHLIYIEEDGTEKLIDKDGNYIAYDDAGNAYKVNKDGERVDNIVQDAFLDDDGNPIDLEDQSLEIKKPKKKKAETPE